MLVARVVSAVSATVGMVNKNNIADIVQALAYLDLFEGMSPFLYRSGDCDNVAFAQEALVVQKISNIFLEPEVNAMQH